MKQQRNRKGRRRKYWGETKRGRDEDAQTFAEARKEQQPRPTTPGSWREGWRCEKGETTRRRRGRGEETDAGKGKNSSPGRRRLKAVLGMAGRERLLGERKRKVGQSSFGIMRVLIILLDR